MAKDSIGTMQRFYQFEDYITEVSCSFNSLDKAADVEKINYVLRI